MAIEGEEMKANGLDEEFDSPSEQQGELQQGIDYYVENGLFVFTAAYLLKRGYCCESGCRHCPYGYQSL